MKLLLQVLNRTEDRFYFAIRVKGKSNHTKLIGLYLFVDADYLFLFYRNKNRKGLAPLSTSGFRLIPHHHHTHLPFYNGITPALLLKQPVCQTPFSTVWSQKMAKQP